MEEYTFYKTAKKTAKENNLVLCDGIFNNSKRLFDFSLLEKIEISEREKEVIKNFAMKTVSTSSKESFYGLKFDNFSACDGIARYYIQRVWTSKLVYIICTLSDLVHYSKTRVHSYDNYNIETIKINNRDTESIREIYI